MNLSLLKSQVVAAVGPKTTARAWKLIASAALTERRTEPSQFGRHDWRHSQF
jgi:hypothetical protein